jgi:hypothetical protein
MRKSTIARRRKMESPRCIVLKITCNKAIDRSEWFHIGNDTKAA